MTVKCYVRFKDKLELIVKIQYFYQAYLGGRRDLS
jgi:hypothetical protein